MKTASPRSLRAAGRLGPVLGLVLTFGILVQAAAAQQVIVIGNDRGGYVGERARLVDQIRAANVRVEITGRICYSACTMYLGAGNVCISPSTTFGFHGPTRNGRSLAPADFDRWSAVMARYYAPPLRDWYMQTARFENSGVVQVRGSQLLQLGYASC
jgi:hypothetical protein